MVLLLFLLAAVAIWIAGTTLWAVAFEFAFPNPYTWRRTAVASALLLLAVLAWIPISHVLDDGESGANFAPALPFIAAWWLLLTGLAAIPLLWVIGRVVRGGPAMPTRTHRSVGYDRTAHRSPSSEVDRSRS